MTTKNPEILITLGPKVPPVLCPIAAAKNLYRLHYLLENVNSNFSIYFDCIICRDSFEASSMLFIYLRLL